MSGELGPPDYHGLRGVIYQITATHVIPKRVPNAIDQSLQVPVISSRKSWLGTGTRRSAQPPSGYTATREVAPRAPALHSITPPPPKLWRRNAPRIATRGVELDKHGVG